MTSSNTSTRKDFKNIKSHAEAMDAIHIGSNDLATSLAHAVEKSGYLAHVGLGRGIAMDMFAKKERVKLYSEVKANIKKMRGDFTTGKTALKERIKREAVQQSEGEAVFHRMMLRYYDAAMQFQADLYNRDFDKAEASLKMTITVSNIVLADMGAGFIHGRVCEDRHNLIVDFIKAIVSKSTMEFQGFD